MSGLPSNLLLAKRQIMSRPVSVGSLTSTSSIASVSHVRKATTANSSPTTQHINTTRRTTDLWWYNPRISNTDKSATGVAPMEVLDSVRMSITAQDTRATSPSNLLPDISLSNV